MSICLSPAVGCTCRCPDVGRMHWGFLNSFWCLQLHSALVSLCVILSVYFGALCEIVCGDIVVSWGGWQHQ